MVRASISGTAIGIYGFAATHHVIAAADVCLILPDLLGSTSRRPGEPQEQRSLLGSRLPSCSTNVRPRF
jgi:hypothetical protein